MRSWGYLSTHGPSSIRLTSPYSAFLKDSIMNNSTLQFSCRPSKCICVKQVRHSVAAVNFQSKAHWCGAGQRRGLAVRSNEYDRGSNTDGSDEEGDGSGENFDRDTAQVVLRVLTARAVQRVLLQLQELDIYAAQWLNNFAAEHPPSMDGSQFIHELFAQRGKSIKDPASGRVVTIDPQNLAHRILQVRESMALGVSVGLDSYVALQNTAVLRQHLEGTMYTCGSSGESYRGSRGRRGVRHRGRAQQQPQGWDESA